MTRIFTTSPGNPLARLINWSWSARTEHTHSEVALLAAKLLAWLLASPNRRLRDSATKALVRILDHRPQALAALLDDAAGIDDPYVVERITAVAYGHLLRHRHTPRDQETQEAWRRIGAAATGLADASVAEHILVRHYVQACIQLTTASADSPTPANPERSLSLAAPTLHELATAYGREPSDFLFAVSEIGDDFEHYVIRYACDRLVLPDQDRLQAQQLQAVNQEIDHITGLLRTLLASRGDEARLAQLDDCLRLRRSRPVDPGPDSNDSVDAATALNQVALALQEAAGQNCASGERDEGITEPEPGDAEPAGLGDWISSFLVPDGSRVS